MKPFYLSALYMLLGFTTPLYSQEINMGPRITALGNIGTALQDIWSLQSNQAGLAGLSKPIASISYQNSYLNRELSTQSAVFAYPVGRNIFGASLQRYGFNAYTEQKIGFSYAKKFGNSISASLNLNFHQLKISQYGSTQTYSAEIGLQFKANDKLIIGSHISNPNRSGFSTDIDAAIPVNVQFGASYKFSDKVLLNSGFIKTLNSATDFRLGLEYSVISWLSFRGGVSAYPFRQFAGFGYQLKNLQLDVAASSHPALGFSPQLALSYEF